MEFWPSPNTSIRILVQVAKQPTKSINLYVGQKEHSLCMFSSGMKCQNMLSGKNKEKIIDLSCAELARVKSGKICI